ncbi:hypothetical protein MTBPR1_10594 [Candidatus Terasakiella magnetica]|uniref:Uncharacterized protein n=1 Tax=Candidatus Terasakiella magnetica TaxID=1867952 RepID=A0A1C3RDI1_9PROT|nr:hypothetical protein [Candidatus Terasakiella magnetica]SCA55347.1 hypothetical protein MTBPR1_10594 [Candidatus Terasakiella magnetica]
MFESLQKILLNKALDKPAQKKGKKNSKAADEKISKKIAPPVDDDLRSESGFALDDAIEKLENSGEKMDDLLDANEDLLRQVKLEAAKKMTPERRALIESAMKVRATKAKILEDLDDETRARLYLTALRAFTGKQ